MENPRGSLTGMYSYPMWLFRILIVMAIDTSAIFDKNELRIKENCVCAFLDRARGARTNYTAARYYTAANVVSFRLMCRGWNGSLVYPGSRKKRVRLTPLHFRNSLFVLRAKNQISNQVSFATYIISEAGRTK